MSNFLKGLLLVLIGVGVALSGYGLLAAPDSSDDLAYIDTTATDANEAEAYIEGEAYGVTDVPLVLDQIADNAQNLINSVSDVGLTVYSGFAKEKKKKETKINCDEQRRKCAGGNQEACRKVNDKCGNKKEEKKEEKKQKAGPAKITLDTVSVSHNGSPAGGEVIVADGDTLDVSVSFSVSGGSVKARKQLNIVGFCKDTYPYLDLTGGIFANGKLWKRAAGCGVVGAGNTKINFTGDKIEVTYTLQADASLILSGEVVRLMPGYFDKAGVSVKMGDDSVANPELAQNFCDNFGSGALSRFLTKSAQAFSGQVALTQPTNLPSSLPPETELAFPPPTIIVEPPIKGTCPTANADWRQLKGRWLKARGYYNAKGVPKSGPDRRAFSLSSVDLADGGTIRGSVQLTSASGFPYRQGSIVTSFGGFNHVRAVTLEGKNGVLMIEEREGTGQFKKLASIPATLQPGIFYPVTIKVTPDGGGEKVEASITSGGQTYSVSYTFPNKLKGPVGLTDVFSSVNFDNIQICQGAELCNFSVIIATPTPTSVITATPTPTATTSVISTPISNLAITTTSLPNGQRNQVYSARINATGGGNAEYEWNVSSGILPPGLKLSVAPISCLIAPCRTPAQITGVPTVGGVYNFKVTVKAADLSASKDFVISVTPLGQRPKPSDYGLKEGDIIGAADYGDPDIYIVNDYGLKRVFINPIIFSFYAHLSYGKVKRVTPEVRDAFETSGLFRNVEVNDPKVYALQVTGEDSGILHWVNMTGAQAVAQDSEFFQKIFGINNNEFNWLTNNGTTFGVPYTSLDQIPVYRR